MVGGLWKRNVSLSLSVGAQLGQPRGGAPLLGTLNGASLCMKAQLCNLEWANLPETLRDLMNGGSGSGASLSVGAL